MAQYIDKDALVAEIEERRDNLISLSESCPANTAAKSGFYAQAQTLEGIKNFIDTLEAKEVNTWHLQEKESIYDAVKDWSLHTFACLMKDDTIQKFTGICDEDFEGHINVHIDGVNDDYDDVDDIVKWIEI